MKIEKIEPQEEKQTYSVRLEPSKASTLLKMTGAKTISEAIRYLIKLALKDKQF